MMMMIAKIFFIGISIWLLTLLILIMPGISTLQAQYLFETEKQGRGEPLLFIHGLYSTGEVWDETVDHYSQDYECHILTVAGFGDVPASEERPFLQNVRDSIIRYTRENDLDDMILVGHSMGGFLALWAASEEPDLFRAVISVDGIPYFPVLQMPNITAETAVPLAEQMRERLSGQTEGDVRASQETILATMIRDEENQEKVVEMAVRADSQTQGQVMYEMFTTDLREEIASIQIPVLVFGSWIAYRNYGVTGESAREGYEEQLQNIPDHTFVMSDTARHFIFYDEPQWFREQMDAFLERIE